MATHSGSSAQPSDNIWLEELQNAHERLLSAIKQLARLTSGPVPSKGELANVRWQVSSASLSRRLLWGRIHALLSQRALGTASESAVIHLQETDAQLMQESTRHVGTWSLDAIFGDWPGYCQASEGMRRKMSDAIAQEKRLLYPILEMSALRNKAQ